MYKIFLRIRWYTGLAYRKLFRKSIINQFHQLYYERQDSWKKNTWMGFGISQNPLDVYTYQELIWKIRPKFILQTGVQDGGSMLFFAQMLDLIGAPANTKVIGIDINLTEDAKRLHHPRIQLIEGDSANSATLPVLEGKGLVVLDSDHSEKHVLKELNLYANYADYLVVEDTNIHGHPVLPTRGRGPFEALAHWLPENSMFIVDPIAHRQLFSFHTWLKRIRTE